MGTERELRGVVLDRRVLLSIDEFCGACGASRRVVIEMLQEGVIEPAEERGGDLHFHGEALVRARRALRLVRDLRVNWAGAALALDLLDELERMKLR